MGIRRDLGEYTPDSTLDPIRLDSGVTQLGRLTTTEEQRRQAIDWMLDKMQQQGADEAMATINWSRLDPTVLVVTALVERKPIGGSLYTVNTVEERSTRGADIIVTRAARMARLIDEVSDLNEKGMLS